MASKTPLPERRTKQVQKAIDAMQRARKAINDITASPAIYHSLSSDERRAWQAIVQTGMDMQRDLYALQRMMEANDEQE